MDYRMGVLGGAVMGTIVALINLPESAAGGLTAGSKQAVYTFTVGSMTTKMCEHLAVRVRKKSLAYLLAVAIPAGFTITASYGIHTLKGTPKPLQSTIPTMIAAPIGCLYWARRKRNALEEMME